MVTISIAMTTYNGENYIGEQLASLRDQCRVPDEVLIFDDGSTDATVDIIRAFIADNGLAGWHLSVNPINLGYMRNFHQAIAAARGDLIFLCDQDDVWLSEKLARMEAAFIDHPGLQALCCSFEKMDGGGLPLAGLRRRGWSNQGFVKGRVRPGALHFIPPEQILVRNVSPGCTLALNRTCREVYLSQATLKQPHDWEICIFAAMLGGLAFLNEPLIRYRIHANNTIGLQSQDRNDSVRTPGRRLQLAQMEQNRLSLYDTPACRAVMNPHCTIIFHRYLRFTGRRLRAIRDASLCQWFAALGDFRYYLRTVSLRGIAGDLVYGIVPQWFKARGPGQTL